MRRTLSAVIGASMVLVPLSKLSVGAQFEGAPDNLTLGLLTLFLAVLAGSIDVLHRPKYYRYSASSVLALWAWFLIALSLVLAFRLMTEPDPLYLLDQAAFDMTAYITVVLLLGLCAFSLNRGAYHAILTIRWFFVAYALFYSITLTGFFILGPLPELSDNGTTFSPLVNNLHHTSISAIAAFSLAGICLKFRIRAGSPALQVYVLVLGLIAAYLSGSDKAKASIFLLVLTVSAFLIPVWPNLRNMLKVKFSTIASAFIVGATLATLAAVVIGIDRFVDIAYSSFAEVDYHAGRQTIYSIALQTFWQRPVFGYGPGSHVLTPAGWYDAHSTVLTVLLQTGIVGVIGTVVVGVIWISRLPVNTPALLYFLAFLPYELFGDVLRSTPFWIGLFLVTDQCFHLAYVEEASVRRLSFTAGNRPDAFNL